MGLFKTCPRISISFQKEKVRFSLEVNLTAKRSQFPTQPTGETAEQRQAIPTMEQRNMPQVEKGTIYGL